MSNSQPCRPAPCRPLSFPAAPAPVDPPAPLRRAEDAIDVLLLAASHPVRPEAIALVLDHAHRGMACVVVDGATAPTLPDVATALLVSSCGRTRVSAFVLGTTAPAGGWPTDEHELLWFELRDRFDAEGYDLLDWFVMVDGLALSMAELTDSHSLWLGG